MLKEEVIKHKGKYVFLQLNDGTKFNGTITNILEFSLEFHDKFDQVVTIGLKDISFIMEKKEGKNG